MEPARKAQIRASRSIEKVGKSTGMINDKLKALDAFQKAMTIVSSSMDINTIKK
jgi:hypothetical protein